MRRRLVCLAFLIGLLAPGFGCAKPKVWVAPRIDLHRYGTLGLVEFGSGQGHGAMATRRFLASVHSAQAGVPVLELGTLPGLLHSVGRESMDREAARAIGERYGVDVLVVGHLDIDEPRPRFSVESLTRADASAEIQGTLSTRLVDARSGATLWSDEARGKRTVAHMTVNAGRLPEVAAVDPEGEHGRLVGWLVHRVTGDFRGHWARP